MQEKGFTLVELMISIFILSVCVIAIYSAFSVIFILTSDSADQLTAAYLAQEGVEIIRNLRDTNWLEMDYCDANSCTAPNPSWDDGFSSCINPNWCRVDYSTKLYTAMGSTLSPVPAFNAGDYLHRDTSSNPHPNFYDYNSGPTTKFQRKITITKPSGVNYMMIVTVQVSWDKKATLFDVTHWANDCQLGKNCISVQETLYNWYPLPTSP